MPQLLSTEVHLIELMKSLTHRFHLREPPPSETLKHANAATLQ